MGTFPEISTDLQRWSLKPNYSEKKLSDSTQEDSTVILFMVHLFILCTCTLNYLVELLLSKMVLCSGKMY